MTTTTLPARYGHDYPASKAYAVETRALYLEVMESILDGTFSAERLEIAADLAKRATNSEEAAESMLDALASTDHDTPSQSDRRFALRLVTSMRSQAQAFQLAAVIALGVKAEAIAPIDYPAILDAVFVRRAQAR
jgi:hypothetical protein